MSFVPLIIKTNFDASPKTKDFKFTNPVAVFFVWLISVWAYGFVFNQREYALTYINVVIFLLYYGTRALLIGIKTPEDIKAREVALDDRFPNFWFGQLTTIVVIFIMCSEPLFCDGWFGKAGGHVLFEVALYSYLMSAVFG